MNLFVYIVLFTGTGKVVQPHPLERTETETAVSWSKTAICGQTTIAGLELFLYVQSYVSVCLVFQWYCCEFET